MTTANVLPDSHRALAKLPLRKEWTAGEWLAFLDGWSFARLGFPRLHESGRAHFFDFGRVEADHFAAVPS